MKEYLQEGCAYIIKMNNGGVALISRYLKESFGSVDAHLNKWKEVLSRMADDELQKQAASSIEKKKFHCQGGSVYSLYPGVAKEEAVSFIVAFQTISDYLDNLCDRAGIYDETAFRQLHQAMYDAVNPGEPMRDYYQSYPYKCDGGYLEALVEECRNIIDKLPSYSLVYERVREYVGWYSDLQVYKHLSLDIREQKLKAWAESILIKYPDIYWWEFSAAAGSTLGVFLMVAAAYDSELDTARIDLIDRAYFPWVCGLHIMLDYFIDAEEDLTEGDLNFTFYYQSSSQCSERMEYLVDRAFSCCSALPYSEFHLTVIRGLLAMYLSDPKIHRKEKRIIARKMLRKGGGSTMSYYYICRFLRHCKKL